jgi:hypothetical protein
MVIRMLKWKWLCRLDLQRYCYEKAETLSPGNRFYQAGLDPRKTDIVIKQNRIPATRTLCHEIRLAHGATPVELIKTWSGFPRIDRPAFLR